MGSKIRDFLLKHGRSIFLVVFIVFIAIRVPIFFRPDNLIALGSQATVIGIVSIGMTMLIITGITDISVGALVYLSGVVSTKLFNAYGNIWLSLLAAIAVSVFCSLINGASIAKFGVPALIATLAMQNIARGVASIVIGEESALNVAESYTVIGQSRIAGIPINIIIFAVLFTIGVMLVNKTKFGRYVYALGNNPDALKASGIDIFKVRMTIFLISGILCGLAGVINTSRLGGTQFDLGVGLELSCIAAVVIGGTSMAGGSGKIMGTLLGVFVVAAIDNILRMMNFSVFLYEVIWGFVVFFTVAIDILNHKHEIRQRERDIPHLT